jgi:hypothetical protein
MMSTPAGDKIKQIIDHSGPEPPSQRARKRTLEEDGSLETTTAGLSGGTGDAQTSSNKMQRSTSPATSAHLTKTGRVSKASKGMPVHHCDCGKTYTRAEHLRRHQQNHKPEAFSCDVDGCERVFSREDLLIRHRAKQHDLPQSSDGLVSYTTQTKTESYGISPSPPRHTASVLENDQPHTSSIPLQSSPSSTTCVRKNYIPITQLQPSALAVDAGILDFESSEQPNWSANLPALSQFGNGFHVAEHTTEQFSQFPLTLDTNQSWITGCTTLDVSHSPGSANSTVPTSFWRGASPSSFQPYTPASDTSVCMSRSRADLLGYPSSGDISGDMTDILPKCRDLLEQDQLVTPTSAPQNIGVRQYHHRVDNEQRYLDAYWRLVHPTWPILHRPTFDLSYISPLLRSAMLTLGACSTGHQIDSGNACILHKRCLKVIKDRTINSSHSYRICDMQAILLVELFSTYQSRRPPLQVSRPFQDNYCTLARDVDTNSPNMLFTSHESFEFAQDFAAVTFGCESKQRLLAAYYILDQEQAKLFGRHVTDVPDLIPANLDLPQPVRIWDLDLAPGSADDWHYENRGSLGHAVISCPYLAVSAGEPFDVFMTTLALTYSSSGGRDTALVSQNLVSDLGLPAPLLNSAHVELVRQTRALCSTTPIRALLATAGESWVMAEKLSLYADYKAAQETVRLWTSTSADHALAHALQIIRLHRLHPKTLLFYHEWSLHLASLVIWACTYARRSPNESLRLSIPLSTNAGSVVQVDELDKALAGLEQVATSGSVVWEDAKRVLSWAKTRMEKSGVMRFRGLVSGAIDVLQTLVARGEEDDWF